MSGYTGLTVSPFFAEGNAVVGSADDDIEMNNAFNYDGNHFNVPDTRYLYL